MESKSVKYKLSNITIKKAINYIRENILRRVRIKSTRKYALKTLNLKNDITIISNNCVGGVLHHDLGWQFLTPTVNCFFYAQDYIKYLRDIKYYNSLDVTAEPLLWHGENKVLLHVGDLSLYFIHDSDCDKVIKDWNRRKERINYNRIFVIASDRDGWNEKIMDEFKTLPYTHKCFFTVNQKWQDESWVIYRNYKHETVFPDVIGERGHYKSNKIFDLMKIDK